MNKLSAFLKNIPYLVILLLVGMLFLERECHKCPPTPGARIVTVRSTHIDTLYYPYAIPKPFPVFHDTGSIQYVILPADTLSIVKDYLSRNIYKRILVNDTNAHIVLIDTVTHNKLTQSILQAEFYSHIRTISETRYITSPPTRKLFLGAGIGLNPNQIEIIPSLMYGSKNEHYYSIGYDLMNSNLKITFWWKIKL